MLGVGSVETCSMFVLVKQEQNIKNSYIMTQLTKEQQIANYLISLNKSLGKSLDYTLSIVEWHTMTGKQDNEVKRLISNNW